jgi:hypothetical protein
VSASTLAVEVKAVRGKVREFRTRLTSDGKEVVEIVLATAGGEQRCQAHGDKAKAAMALKSKVEELAQRNGGSVESLGVGVEVEGIPKDGGVIVVTGIKLAA